MVKGGYFVIAIADARSTATDVLLYSSAGVSS